MGVRQVVDIGQQGAEMLAVAADAAHRDAAEADAVIAALAPDQPDAQRLAARALIGEGDLQGGVGALRARVGEEHPVDAVRRRSRPARAAASKAIGWPSWKVGAKSSSAACFWIASMIWGGHARH